MYQDGEHRRFSRFINTSLKLHRAPVLESFNVKFGQKANAIDIKAYVRTAIKRGVHTPSLEILEIEEAIGGFCGIEHKMPKLEAANVHVTCSHTEQIQRVEVVRQLDRKCGWLISGTDGCISPSGGGKGEFTNGGFAC
ncbi:unnamed protein product [Eruca vesicaria subsp. sativa]|uniref:Uncharacterized protein n=1 Tax=Eruca vesicaria subsp. sativa TaxID=29727 RepID=A0ABC8LHF4_ERUVS|nr:unnamed protein product [Eruca vesicaria subsp. sativa]